MLRKRLNKNRNLISKAVFRASRPFGLRAPLLFLKPVASPHPVDVLNAKEIIPRGETTNPNYLTEGSKIQKEV